MRKSKFSEEQGANAIRQSESGTAVAEVCRQRGISEAAFHTWRKRYAPLRVTEMRRLRPLEDESGRLKRPVVDLTHDNHMLVEALREVA